MAEVDPATESETHVYIQWKGTSLCMDFWCECGFAGHIDGDFVYYVRCPDCGAVWEMPESPPLKRVDAVPDGVSDASVAEPESR